jgi:hypothetical protein
LDWKLHWIVVSSNYGRGTDDGMSAGQDTCHAGKGGLSPQGGNGRNEDLVKRDSGLPRSDGGLSEEEGANLSGDGVCNVA